MWNELLSIFRPDDPMHSISSDFKEMLAVDLEMAALVGPHIFTQTLTMEQQSKIYKLDVLVNKREN